MAEQQASGWYPDPGDPNAEIYWDGTRWHGRREILTDQPTGQPDRAAATPAGTWLRRESKIDSTSKQLSDQQFKWVALVGIVLAIAILPKQCANSHDKTRASAPSPVSSTVTTTSTTPTTTAEPPSSTTRPPDPSPQISDTEIASAATEYVAKFVVAPNGDLKQVQCYEGPADPACWILHFDKFTFDRKPDEFGVRYGTLRVWLHGDWDNGDWAENRRGAFGRSAANAVATMILAADNRKGAPSILTQNVEKVVAVDLKGNEIAEGTPRG
jgi:hypothetical protein